VPLSEGVLFGAGSRVRTDDLLITNQLLYQLSYAGILDDAEPEINGDSIGAQPVFFGCTQHVSALTLNS
jgi:hypothetical protein